MTAPAPIRPQPVSITTFATLTEVALQCVMAVVLAVVIAQPCLARMSAEEMQSHILKTKILPADSRVTAKFAGAELNLSLYRQEAATDNDCKIDAVLLAKSAFDVDAELARVNVLFYDARVPNLFDEISVTLGDVKAYGGGQLSKQQLLSTLKLISNRPQPSSAEKHSLPPPPSSSSSRSSPVVAPPAPLATSSTVATEFPLPATSQAVVVKSGAPGEPLNQSLTPKVVTPRAAGTNTASGAGLVTYRSNYGVTLFYPKGWRVEHPRSGSTVVRFYPPSQSFSVVDMLVFPAKETTPSQIVADDPRDTLEPLYAMSRLQGVPETMHPYVKSKIDEFRKRSNAAQQHLFAIGRSSEFKSWRSQQHNFWTTLAKVALASKVYAGKDKTVPCSQGAYWVTNSTPAEANQGLDKVALLLGGHMIPRFYVRMVAFNAPTGVVVLALYSAEAGAGRDNAQFEQLISTLECFSVLKPSAIKSTR